MFHWLKGMILCFAQVFTFFASLFGDLIESIIKRDAGMKVGKGA